VSRPSADALEDAARRIEGWLLDSGVQLAEGAQQGGVAGWLDQHGRPEFVYLEITGYYLTTMGWLATGAASSGERAAVAVKRGRQALDWVRSATADNAVPATRLYLSPERDDWRNAAIFSFDLAMAARGVACLAAATRVEGAETLVRDLGARVREICLDRAPLPSHALREGAHTTLPDRWSTRPGPHHLKAAGALLRLPADLLDGALLRACRQTVAHWTRAMQASWPCRELHPLLYGLEGLLILEPAPSEQTLDMMERMYERLLRLQAADGSLPAAAVSGAGEVRSDVLAQALRVGALLRGTRRLNSERARRLDALATALLRYVRADGGVLFSTEQAIANTWCAMFAHQALLLHSRTRNRVSLAAADVTDRLI
jgi:hypothetical protein